jgi:ATP-dependent phosphofructokinase / diphosphate-dependent phosphofructokinase
MATAERKIGIMTGGGDCPGLNVVLRAVVKSLLLGPGIRTIGFRNGYYGLVVDDAVPLDYESVSGLLTRGGTIIGTSNTANPFAWRDVPPGAAGPVGDALTAPPEDRSGDVLATVKRHGLEGLVIIGGDGTMAGAAMFHDLGIPIVGIPKTIDNDLRGTELTFGFHTAVAVAVDAIDRVHDTAMSHHRVMIVEVMGRYAGWLALTSGVAGGADVVLIPEIPYRLEAILDKVRHRSGFGKRFTIIAVAEGAHEAGGHQVVHSRVEHSPDPVRLGGVGNKLAQDIEREGGMSARATVLGHVQRGGTPIPFDRLLCTGFGHRAAELVAAGAWGQLVAYRDGRVVTAPLTATKGGPRLVPLDHPLIQAARAVGTSFGDYETRD